MKSLQDLRFIPKTSSFLQIPSPHFPTAKKIPSFPKSPSTHLPKPIKLQLPTQKAPTFFDFPVTHLPNLTLMSLFTLPLPSFASETGEISDKINIESILTSIDDFFNRYPFFVAGVTVIWLVVIPLTEEYLKKCKFISAIDAFRKLRDEPNAQLLDIRKEQSLKYLSSPSLKSLNKSVVQLEFVEGEEEGFVEEVLKRFGDPANTILCVLDNFDGNSLKVAELLFKNGFKEVYAIKGGLRGNDGWQAIQETLLPPSMHVYPRKKKKKSSLQLQESKDGMDKQNNGNGQVLALSTKIQEESQSRENCDRKPTETDREAKISNGRPLSPYTMYPDLKPPSSPTPSKSQS